MNSRADLKTQELMMRVIIKRLETLKEEVEENKVGDFTEESKEQLVKSIDDHLEIKQSYQLISGILKDKDMDRVVEEIRGDETAWKDLKLGNLAAEGFLYCVENLITLSYLDFWLTNTKVRKRRRTLKEEEEKLLGEYKDLITRTMEKIKKWGTKSTGVTGKNEPCLIWACKMMDILLVCFKRCGTVVCGARYYQEPAIQSFLGFIDHELYPTILSQLNFLEEEEISGGLDKVVKGK